MRGVSSLGCIFFYWRGIWEKLWESEMLKWMVTLVTDRQENHAPLVRLSPEGGLFFCLHFFGVSLWRHRIHTYVSSTVITRSAGWVHCLISEWWGMGAGCVEGGNLFVKTCNNRNQYYDRWYLLRAEIKGNCYIQDRIACSSRSRFPPPALSSLYFLNVDISGKA